MRRNHDSWWILLICYLSQALGLIKVKEAGEIKLLYPNCFVHVTSLLYCTILHNIPAFNKLPGRLKFTEWNERNLAKTNNKYFQHIRSSLRKSDHLCDWAITAAEMLSALQSMSTLHKTQGSHSKYLKHSRLNLKPFKVTQLYYFYFYYSFLLLFHLILNIMAALLMRIC